jgi:hypothetical protein
MRELVAEVGLLKVYQETEYVDVPVTTRVCVNYNKQGKCTKYEDKITIEKQIKLKKNKIGNDMYIIQYYADDALTIEEIVSLDQLKQFTNKLIELNNKVKIK